MMTKERRHAKALRYLDEACEILDSIEARPLGIERLSASRAVPTQIQSVVVAMMLTFMDGQENAHH